MNSKFIIKVGVFSATVLMFATNAQAIDVVKTPTPPTPVTQSTATSSLYRQLDALRSQNAILTETLKNEKLKSDISNVGKAPISQGSPFSGAPQGTPISTSQTFPLAPSAQVMMVSGAGSDLTAVISLPNGGSVAARVGRNIAGLGVVKSITAHEVVVANKTETVSLPFANASTTSAGGGANMPSFNPLMMPGGVR